MVAVIDEMITSGLPDRKLSCVFPNGILAAAN